MYQRTTLLVICLVALVHGTPPTGYKPKSEEPDPNPPKYEYGYKIQDEKGLLQGKIETRDGIYALGRYYVKGSSSSQNVDYLADDWGYHPYVQYSNVGPHSRASAQIALGKEAITAFQRNNNGDPPLTLNPDPNSPSASVTTPSIRDPKENIQLQTTNEYQPQQSQQQPQEGTLQEQIPPQQKEEIQQEQGKLDPQQNQLNQQLENVEAQQSAQQLQQQQLAQQQQQVAKEQDRAREQQLEKQLEQQQLEQQLEQQQLQQQPFEQQQLEHQQLVQQQQPQQISEEQKLNPEQQLEHQQSAQQQVSKDQKLAREQQLAQEEKHQLQEEQKQNAQKQEDLSNQQAAQQILQQQLPLQTSQSNDFLKLNQVAYNDQNINNQPFISQDGNLLSTQGHLSDAQGVQLVYMPQQIQDNIEGLFQQINTVQSNSQQSVQPFIIMQSQPFGNNVVLVDQNGNGIIQDGHAQLGQQYSNYQENQHASASFTSANFQHTLVDDNGQAPLALPLVYQQQAQINNAVEPAQQVNEQRTEQSQVNVLDGSGVKETAALFDSGTDMSKEDIHVENKLSHLSGSYGSKIFENQSSKPSKLIESTKNLITELDVLSINDAAKFETSPPATHTVNQEIVSISESSSSHTNVQVSSTTSATLLDHESPVTPLSLVSNPIVVEDYNAASVETSEEQKESYSKNSLAHEIVVTPRPDIKFLAPITAGVQLQNIDKQPPESKQNIVVEIQKSVPYYVGKYEFFENADYNQNSPEGALQNLKLGGALIDFPVKEQISTILKTSILEENKEENKAVLTNTLDQQGEQGTIQQVEVSSSETDELPKQIVTEKPVLTKYIEKPYPVPYTVEKVVEKYINRPYPVHVPVHIPVEVPITVERKVPVPYPVEKIIDRPVPVPQPYPYPVEKIVEKKVPIEVTKYVDRPYPVHVAIPQPYPVEKIVEKVVNKPYAVPVQYQVLVPHQIPHYQHPQLPTPQAYYLPVDDKQHPNNINSGKVRQYYYSNPYVYVNSYQSVQKNIKNQHQATQENRVHLSYTTTPVKNQKQQHHQQQQQQQHQQQQQQQQQQQPQYVITPQNYNTQQQYISWEVPGVNCKPVEQNQYIGLLPPKDPNAVSNKRQAKSFETPRMEYGFLPPLIPSLEIDENGRPLKHSS